jgi:phosphoglycolate phosphatase-like HAD superfamily hydrolase
MAHALAQLEPLPERVVMVGDRAHDVEGAAAHGINTVVVDWGYGRADFAEPTAHAAAPHAATVDDLREVLGVYPPQAGGTPSRSRGGSGV